MNVLIACEFSGVVREAFRRRGHRAYSCDLKPALDKSPYHLQCNVLYVLDPQTDATYYRGPAWDLLIAHPDCTYLTNAGVRWLYVGGRGTVKDDTRWKDMRQAARFFNRLRLANIPRVCVENPIMHGHALNIIGQSPTQIISPKQFGHSETKATCLWLHGLPMLKPTRLALGSRPRVHHESPGKAWMDVEGRRHYLTRAERRSITYRGIAEAMAEQWGGLDR